MQLEELSKAKGVYALHLHLEHAVDLMVGALGKAHFPDGDYLYIGSAFGPGGVRARMGRHLRGDGKMHWHIDILRKAAQVLGGYYHTPAGAGDELPTDQDNLAPPYECRWVQALAALPGWSAQAPGFGASDCRAGCISHLLFSNNPQNTFYVEKSLGALVEILARSIQIQPADPGCIHILDTRQDQKTCS